MQNGLVKSFNGKLRDECLNEWKHDYRSHSAHGSKPPAGLPPNPFRA
jgi:hypothetical protein